MTRTIRLLLFVAASPWLAACGHDTLCPSDEVLCDGRCTTLATDLLNCGACGNVCSGRETCSAGTCRLGASAADLYLACYNTNEVRTANRDLVAVGAPVGLDAPPVGLAWANGELFAAAAGNGGAETVARITGDLATLHAEAVWKSNVPLPDIEFVTEHGGNLYLAHNSLGTLLVLSATGNVIEQHTFVAAGQPNPNPQGIAFAGDRAYVALQALNQLSVLDLSQLGTCPTPGSCITEVARIDLQPLASPGAQAMPARVAIVGSRAYVTLWNLASDFSLPAGGTGRLAAVNLASNAPDATANPGGPAGLVNLGPSCLDPADLGLQGSTLYVSCGAFVYPAIVGQGIVPIDVSGATPVVQPILPAPSDAAPGRLAFCSGNGYVADRNTGRVFRFDPAAGAVDGASLCPAGSGGFAYVADIACGF